MHGEKTKDCLGGFVERYIALFVEEIKYFIESNSDELKSRIQRLDHSYIIEDQTYLK